MKPSIVNKGLTLGSNPQVGDFSIIGEAPRGRQAGELELKIGDNCVIRSHNVIYAGNKIGNNFQTGHHCMIRENNLIGDDVSIGTSSVVEHSVTIGNRVRIHSQVFIPEFSTLEDDCWIGPNVVFTNAPYPKGKDAKNLLKGPHIEREAKIGANCTLLPGVKIGQGALIGAGSVVTKDIEPFTVVAGNPAKALCSIFELKNQNGDTAYSKPGNYSK